MKLYSYHRSSAAYRVRIALNLKNLCWDYVPVNLLQSEQRGADYLALNPQGLVPTLQTDSGELLAQSVAILEWLEETHPQPALLPADPLLRARVRAVVNSIACDVHPLNNISVLNYLRKEIHATEEQVQRWYGNWVERGFRAIENVLAEQQRPFCFGDQPGLADVCLVPQVYNANRFEVPMAAYPNICRVARQCNALEAFAAAAPERQPDAG
jgi:maleylacetoacetate isomerase